MNFKVIIGVIIISIIVGFALFFWRQEKTIPQSAIKTPFINTNSEIENTPQPSPSMASIDASSDLKEAINMLTVPDFSNDYKSINSAVESNF